MNSCITCKEAIEHCMSTHTFAFAHLYGDEKIMDMHIHNCCEVYYSISGGKQFLIEALHRRDRSWSLFFFP